jgi:nucleoid DNA-binding protein
MEVTAMGKQVIEDLAAVLTEKNGLPKADAQRFVTAIFDVIQDGLDRDKQVKLKGLGTFKVVDVEARESVNVNTGERVVIDSHSKISFTPDATMRELVNKPFSGFETTVLNEGVVFDDMDADGRELADEDTAMVENVADIPSAPEVESAPQAVETILQEEVTPQEEVAPQEEVTSQEEEDTPQPVEYNPQEKDEQEEEDPQSCGWGKWLLLTLLACGLSFGGGYWLGMQHLSEEAEETVVEEDVTEKPVEQSLAAAPADTLQEKEDSLVAQSIAQKDSVEQADSAKQAEPAKSAEPVKLKESEPVVDNKYKKYEEMDVRVRTGAYRIVGTDQVVKVREGDTPAKVSRRYLGAGMECYLEVYNGITSQTPLKVGQELKVPKLEWKKKKNKQK